MSHLTGAIRQDYQGKILYWSEDESRVGLLTEQGRRITALGVKPIGKVQWEFKYKWVYGAISPQNGASFFWEFSHLNSSCFGCFLEELSRHYPEHFHLIQVDNARAHTAKALKIPSNIRLLFQPPYCPEVNAIERVWQELKRAVQWQLFEDLEAIQARLTTWTNQLSADAVQSLTQWSWITDGLSKSAIY